MTGLSDEYAGELRRYVQRDGRGYAVMSEWSWLWLLTQKMIETGCGVGVAAAVVADFDLKRSVWLDDELPDVIVFSHRPRYAYETYPAYCLAVTGWLPGTEPMPPEPSVGDMPV